MLPFISGDGGGRATVAFGTRIRSLLGGGFGFTHLLNMNYTDAGTVHTLTAMRGVPNSGLTLGRSKVVGAVAAGGTAVVVKDALTDGAGNAIAASDMVGIQLDDGSWHLSAVTTYVAATLTISVLATAIPTGRSVLDGAAIVNYGVAGDTMHAKYQYKSGTGSAAVNIPAVAGECVSLCKATRANEPILFDSDNPTATGILNYANVGQTLQ